MDTKQTLFQDVFYRPVEKTGKWTVLIAVLCLFIPGLYLRLFYGLFPPLGALVRALIGIWSFAIVFSIVEPIIYFSLIGFGGTYMSFLSGNLVNLRLPISITAQQVVGTDEGSPESEIVSTLGVAGSIVACQLVLTVGSFSSCPSSAGSILPEHPLRRRSAMFFPPSLARSAACLSSKTQS